MKRLLPILLLVFSVGVGADVTGSARVTDGDSIKISNTRVRLHGIDAPERNQSCQKNGRTWRCGSAATSRLRGMVSGREVRCKGNRNDRYGRLLAVCYVDGTDVNAAMVTAGLALAYRKYSSDYVSQERDAKRAKRGLWAGEFVAPWDWRRGKRLENKDADQSSCCKICRKGKACGNSCIRKTYNCGKLPGCACDAR